MAASPSFRLARLFAALLFVAAFHVAPAAAQDAGADRFDSRTIAVVGGRLAVKPGLEIDGGTLVVRNGLIVAAGRDVEVPLDAEVIDAEGLIVYPGFIDAAASDLLDGDKAPKPPEGRKVDFSRHALAETRPDNRRGLTPDFRAAEALKLEAAALEKLRQAGFTDVHVLPEGRIAGGRGALVSAANGPPRETVLSDATCSQFELRALRGREYPATLMGAAAHLRQAFLDTSRYRLHRKLYAGGAAVPRPATDPVLDALGDVLEKKQRAAFFAESRDAIHRALDFGREHGIDVAIVGGRDAHRCLERLQDLQTDLVVRIDFGEQPKIEPNKVKKPNKKKESGKPAVKVKDPLRAQRYKLHEWRERVAGLRKLHRGGIRFALTSRGLKGRDELLAGVRRAIEAGLSREAALAALTTDAAAILGLDNRLGTLEPGRLAHVVVMTGPFDHPQAKVRHVLIERQKFEYNEKAKSLLGTSRPVVAQRPAQRFTPLAESDSRGLATEQLTLDDLPTEVHPDRLAARVSTGGNVLIKGGTVLTGTRRTLKNASILVKDGKIAAVGQNLSVPKDVRVIDATGRYVMPGMIDTHAHIMISGGVNEYTQSIVPEVRVKDVVATDHASEYRALAGGVTAARLFHGSANVVGGQDAVVKLRYGKTAAEHILHDAPQGVKFALGENVKYRSGRFPNTRLGVEATLNRAFMEAIDYRRGWQEYQRQIEEASKAGKPDDLLPPRRDLRLEALADIVNHEKFIHSHCYRADEILMLLRVAEGLGIRVWSLQHVLEGYKIAPEIAQHGASCSTFADWWAYKVEAYDATPYNAALLNEAGINVVVKSDNAELMRNLNHEAAKPVRYGEMPVGDAIAAVTLNAARELGLEKRLGSIEVGKDADLAIFSGHPLGAFSRCEMTLIDGEVYFDRSRAATAMSPAAAKRSANPQPLQMASPKHRQRELDLSESPSGKYAITGALVHTVDGGTIAEGTVVIADGKIAAVGRGIEIPSDATVIDAAGMHVSPGFIDAGTTLGLVEIGKVRETHDYSESGLMQPDLRAGVGLNRDSELIGVARAGGITEVLIRPTGGVIAGQASLARLAGWTAPEMVIDLEAGLAINWPRGRDAEKRKKELKEFLSEARRYDELVKKARKAGRPGPVADPRYEALRPYIRGEKPVFIEAESATSIAEALAFAEEEKLTPVITGGTDAWKLAAELKKHDVPVIVGPVMRSPLADHDPYDAPYANPGRLYEAGVKFCIRSDNASNSRNAPFEAAKAVAFGLPVEDALRAVTLSPAEILGVADRLGSITPGKEASLAITAGHPLEHTSIIKGVFVSGRPFEPESRQTRFYKEYRRRLKQTATR